MKSLSGKLLLPLLTDAWRRLTGTILANIFRRNSVVAVKDHIIALP